MENSLAIPSKWQEKFLLKRINEEDIELTLEQRNGVLIALDKGARFAQIGKYTIMLNAIKSIDPLWGDDNIPPQPKEITSTSIVGNKALTTITNQNEIDLWFKLFGQSRLGYCSEISPIKEGGA